jgi:2-polyprenyl-3-methyl-5-hydroxy-6-metoxy-1,4-benzoquinol methylase
MKNLLDERPDMEPHGRLAYTLAFVGRHGCEGRDILDIGCGFGWFEKFALDQVARSIVGLEPDEADLRAALRDIDDGRASFEAGSALELRFPDESFDAVVMWEVLEHLPSDTEADCFSEIARVLRPGGSLYLSTPHSTPLTIATDPARWLIGHRHYTRSAVAQLASSAGLTVRRLELRGGIWEIIHLNVLYISKWVFRRPPFFERTLRARIDREWKRDGEGFVHVFLEAEKAGA